MSNSLTPKEILKKSTSSLSKMERLWVIFPLLKKLPEDFTNSKPTPNGNSMIPNLLFLKKKFRYRQLVLPRLKMKLDFEREAYGPGAEVSAELDLQTNANQALSHYDFSYTVQLQGVQILKGNSKTDQEGKTNIAFNLPKELETNDGLINVMIAYQGQTESISRSVPIVLNQIELSFYPRRWRTRQWTARQSRL